MGLAIGSAVLFYVALLESPFFNRASLVDLRSNVIALIASILMLGASCAAIALHPRDTIAWRRFLTTAIDGLFAYWSAVAAFLLFAWLAWQFVSGWGPAVIVPATILVFMVGVPAAAHFVLLGVPLFYVMPGLVLGRALLVWARRGERPLAGEG